MARRLHGYFKVQRIDANGVSEQSHCFGYFDDTADRERALADATKHAKDKARMYPGEEFVVLRSVLSVISPCPELQVKQL